MIEMITEVDEQDNVIALRPREEFYTGRYIHRGAQVLLFNSQGKILITRKAKKQHYSPGKFNYSAGGTVRESPMKNVHKER